MAQRIRRRGCRPALDPLTHKAGVALPAIGNIDLAGAACAARSAEVVAFRPRNGLETTRSALATDLNVLLPAGLRSEREVAEQGERWVVAHDVHVAVPARRLGPVPYEEAGDTRLELRVEF